MVKCDSCEMKALGFTLSNSLEVQTGFTCQECMDWKPNCDSCKSTEIKIEAAFGYCFKSCYDCGYTIESTFVAKMPNRLYGVMSEEAMAFLDDPANCEVKISMKEV